MPKRFYQAGVQLPPNFQHLVKARGLRNGYLSVVYNRWGLKALEAACELELQRRKARGAAHNRKCYRSKPGYADRAKQNSSERFAAGKANSTEKKVAANYGTVPDPKGILPPDIYALAYRKCYRKGKLREAYLAGRLEEELEQQRQRRVERVLRSRKR